MNAKHLYLPIGNNPRAVDSTKIGIVKVTGMTLFGNIFGCIENQGDVPLIFAVNESDDNNVGDAWSAVNFRVSGSSVSSVTVQPRGRVEFFLEWVTAFKTGTYRLFKVTTSASSIPVPMGMLGLISFTGDLETRVESEP